MVIVNDITYACKNIDFTNGILLIKQTSSFLGWNLRCQGINLKCFSHKKITGNVCPGICIERNYV